MTVVWVIAAIVGALLLVAFLAYAASRFYIVRADRTYMVHDETDYRRALKGWGIIWDPLESKVKGPTASRLEFPSYSYSDDKPCIRHLRDQKTGAVSLKPHYCVPPKFRVLSADNHDFQIDVQVQFSLNRDLLRYTYKLESFGDALVIRVQEAFRAEIGQRKDEQVRADVGVISQGVIARLRQAERDGDEETEEGMALGVTYHTASFTFKEIRPDSELDEAILSVASGPATAESEQRVNLLGGVRRQLRSQGVATIRPQDLDALGDVFVGRSFCATEAVLAILELQTRQNIAEALAASGHLVVVTGQELGLTGASAQLEAMREAERRRQAEAGAPPADPAG